MKLIHLSDLHIGKRLGEYSLLEDQEYILNRILEIIDDENPDGVMIAGDVYDKSVPSEDAVSLFGAFLTKLAERRQQVYVISGNHDSAVKLAFASDLIDLSGIHISPVYDGTVKQFTVSDEFGDVNICLLPFIRPIQVRKAFETEEEENENVPEIHSYTDACRTAVSHMNIDPAGRNVLIAHQFVVGAQRCDSEDASVGGLDSVSGDVFDVFDYVALGHIHGPQHVGRDTLRYCGTPLKYSVSEEHHHKSVTIVEIGEKKPGDAVGELVNEESGTGFIRIRERELIPLHNLRTITGTFAELSDPANFEGTDTDDYVQVVLTDEDEIIGAGARLGMIYPRIVNVRYDNRRTRANGRIDVAENVEEKSPLELFEEFYETQNGSPLSDVQRAFMESLIASVWEGNE